MDGFVAVFCALERGVMVLGVASPLARAYGLDSPQVSRENPVRRCLNCRPELPMQGTSESILWKMPLFFISQGTLE